MANIHKPVLILFGKFSDYTAKNQICHISTRSVIDMADTPVYIQVILCRGISS